MTGLCLGCSEPIGLTRETRRQTKYCGAKCQQDWLYAKFIANWLMGLQIGWMGKTKELSNHVRRYIRETLGTACQHCGWDERHPDDGAVLTEIDHIDGKADNAVFDNLRVLCPNCHSKTSTFRARNKKSTRER